MGQQYDGLVNLIGQAGISDAFDLDVADEQQINDAIKQGAKPPRSKASGNGTSKPLNERHDEDVAYLREADTVKMRRLHNRLTNALRAVRADAGLILDEGNDKTCLFDARVRNYQGADRHLLIEVKTDASAPMCRMAVGQLLDYRRRLGDRAATDLAVLLPEAPTMETRAFLHHVGVKVMWIDVLRKRLHGEVEIGRSSW